MSTANSLPMTPFLRNVLLFDAVVSGAAGVLMVAGSGVIAPMTQLPTQLLVWCGLAMLPWCVALVAMSRRATLPRVWLSDVIGLNVLWVAASFGLLASGLIAPNWLGFSFVAVQAIAVAVFAALQVTALRRERAVLA